MSCLTFLQFFAEAINTFVHGLFERVLYHFLCFIEAILHESLIGDIKNLSQTVLYDAHIITHPLVKELRCRIQHLLHMSLQMQES